MNEVYEWIENSQWLVFYKRNKIIGLWWEYSEMYGNQSKGVKLNRIIGALI